MMMKILLFLHLVLLSVWLGCVLVEAIYEHSIEKTDAMRIFVSRLHWTTDKFIEIPAFVGVLLTGAVMATQVPLTPLLTLQILFGLTAIVFNAICVYLVVRRLRHAEALEFDVWAWEAIDHKQHLYGAVVLIELVLALSIGGYLYVAA